LNNSLKPGRSCPVNYRYHPATATPTLPDTGTLYVVGGLYGNTCALEALENDVLKRETGPYTCVFNGDYHWFDINPDNFRKISQSVQNHHAILGNVEAEFLTGSDTDGCGCAYPEEVNNDLIDRSNQIHRVLKQTAAKETAHLEWLKKQPMQYSTKVGEHTIRIVHGDAWSLSGWNFSTESLAHPSNRLEVDKALDDSGTGIYACSHTCLPVMRYLGPDNQSRLIVNNGAAGMPNFSNTNYGIVTRIGISPSPIQSIYGTSLTNGSTKVYVDAIALHYDHGAWLKEFLGQWPAGSAAHQSYWKRINQGPTYSLTQARSESLKIQ
jgi:hypothetical protein